MAALALFFLLRLRRAGIVVPSILAAAILGGSVALSHAASRVDDRPLLLLLTAGHHLGAAAWIGGMASLLVAIRNSTDARKIHTMAQTFFRDGHRECGASRACRAGNDLFLRRIVARDVRHVVWLHGHGEGVSSPACAHAWSEQFLAVRRTRSDAAPVLLRLRRFSEAEIGLGFTAMLRRLRSPLSRRRSISDGRMCSRVPKSWSA